MVIVCCVFGVWVGFFLLCWMLEFGVIGICIEIELIFKSCWVLLEKLIVVGFMFCYLEFEDVICEFFDFVLVVQVLGVCFGGFGWCFVVVLVFFDFLVQLLFFDFVVEVCDLLFCCLCVCGWCWLYVGLCGWLFGFLYLWDWDVCFIVFLIDCELQQVVD